MLVDKTVIGQTSNPQEFEVEKGAIRAFARAVGDENPLYTDETYAKDCGYEGLVAPPTFPTTFRVRNAGLQLPLARVLHGEQSYSYERPIVAGDILSCVSKVVDVYEREGSLGNMTFVVSEVSGTDTQGNPVFRGQSTIILR